MDPRVIFSKRTLASIFTVLCRHNVNGHEGQFHQYVCQVFSQNVCT